MIEYSLRDVLLRRLAALIILTGAAVGPAVFPLAAWFGYSDGCWYCNLKSLGAFVLLPSVALMGAAMAAAWRCGAKDLARAAARGIAWGIVATVALEAIRWPGFRMGWMPGDLPRFMGVQLLGQFSEGPSVLSDLVGRAYHFWNGACFGVTFALLAGRPSWWKGMAYGVAVGIGFMASPVVVGLGIGRFGVDFGPQFAITVTAAHAAFGAVLGGGLGWSRARELPEGPLGSSDHHGIGAYLPWTFTKSSCGCDRAESSRC